LEHCLACAPSMSKKRIFTRCHKAKGSPTTAPKGAKGCCARPTIYVREALEMGAPFPATGADQHYRRRLANLAAWPPPSDLSRRADEACRVCKRPLRCTVLRCARRPKIEPWSRSARTGFAPCARGVGRPI